ncbi:histidine phosphatase superfamily [Fennellomyces sp. T-0311]|nr:histidine phosphatase superfamily [Fennellomyces sp. T-0311]
MATLPGADSGHYPEDLELTRSSASGSPSWYCTATSERTPVRKRLEKLFPAVWHMCDANAHMFATIVALDSNASKQFVPLQRLVDAEQLGKHPHVHRAGSCFYGQLTNIGRHSMAALGARLREIYIQRLKFLPDVYDGDAVSIRSTDYARTQESVQQLVAGGLYPADKRNDDFVLKIRTRDPVTDNLFPNPNCYRLRQLAKESKKEVNEICKDKFASLTDRLKKHVDSVSLDSHPSANGILDTLVAARAHGFDLPEDIDDQVLRDLEDVVVLEWFHGAMHNDEYRRLGMGRLVGEIRDRIEDKVSGKDDTRKLHVYSGHDTTVGPLLISLGAFDKRWPPFSSAVIFELFKQKGGDGGWFKKTDKHFVRVRYNDKLLQLPGCAQKGEHYEGDATLCTLEAFQKIVKDQVPENWTEECRYRA